MSIRRSTLAAATLVILSLPRPPSRQPRAGSAPRIRTVFGILSVPFER